MEITTFQKKICTIKIGRLSVTIGDHGKRRAARDWLSASQQQTLSGRAALAVVQPAECE